MCIALLLQCDRRKHFSVFLLESISKWVFLKQSLPNYPGQCGSHSLVPQIPWERAWGLKICQSDRCFNLMKWIHAALSFKTAKFRYNSQNPPQASTSLPFSPSRCNLEVIIVLKQENYFFFFFPSFFLKGGRGDKPVSKGPTQKALWLPLGYARN